MDIGHYFWSAAAVLLLISIFQTIRRARKVQKRHQWEYREILEPMIQAYGLALISSRFPGRFQVGPFPMIEWRQDRNIFIRGGPPPYFDEYRILIIRDQTGWHHEVWVILEFEFDSCKRVRWRALQKENLPQAFAALMEN